MKLAVQFGAGNIGRGFMGQLFREAGYRIVFVEANASLVQLLNESGKYPLRILDAYTKKEIDMVIDQFDAVSTAEHEKVAEAISGADVVGTAVGVKNLAAIAPLIAEGLEMRAQKNPAPLDIYLCENIRGAAESLQQEVMGGLDGDMREWVLENVGFVGTSVARMVPAASDRFGVDDPLFVAADAYHKLPYDVRAVRAEVPEIEGLEPVSNFKAEVERKLFTHNLGHAALAYLGYLKGYSYVHEPFDDDFLNSVFEGALDETTEALLKMYPSDLDREEHMEIRRDVRIRFGNPMMMDTVQRVARDPVRKLGPEDRLIGSARLCLAQGVFPENVAYVSAAALCYDFEGDPDAVKLQAKIRETGVEKVLEEISHVNPASELGEKIAAVYYELQEGKKT